MNPRIILTAAVAGLFCTQALVAQPAKPPAKPAAAAPAGPWAKVPALPTACYSSQDKWSEQSTAAFDAVQEAHYAQNDTNSAISQNATDTFSSDPFAVMQRMQQEMMNDPQKAQKIMEQTLQQNEQAQTEAPARSAKEQQIENESKALMKQYEAALQKAMGPAVARWIAVQKKMGWSVDPNFAFMPDPSWPDWAWQEWAGIQKDRDAAYVANCAHWWKATGPIHAYLKRYKDFLVLERIPFEKKGDEAQLEHYRQIGISTQGWRTTTDYEAVEDYLKMAQNLFGQREETPLCTAERSCQ